ncbi:MAG: hypothetical protein P8Y93_06280 [Acidobacteriota bacterium]
MPGRTIPTILEHGTGVRRMGSSAHRLEDLAAEIGVEHDPASLWGRRGAKRRSEGRDFAAVAARRSAAANAPERECPNV